MAQTQVILLERIERLGQMGDMVTVKPGYARNYLLPQKKALRATKENVAYFEAQRKRLEAESDKQKKEAEKVAKKIEGLKVPLIRQASEAGQLFGSVTSRDIAKEVSEESKESVTRQMVELNQNFKVIGLFPVTIALHPEVRAQVIINIARTKEEAETQAKTGKALIAEDSQVPEAENQAKVEDRTEEQLEEALEEEALKAEKQKQQVAKEKEKAKKKAEADKAEAKAAEEAAKEEAAGNAEKPEAEGAGKAEDKE